MSVAEKGLVSSEGKNSFSTMGGNARQIGGRLNPSCFWSNIFLKTDPKRQ